MNTLNRPIMSKSHNLLPSRRPRVHLWWNHLGNTKCERTKDTNLRAKVLSARCFHFKCDTKGLIYQVHSPKELPQRPINIYGLIEGDNSDTERPNSVFFPIDPYSMIIQHDEALHDVAPFPLEQAHILHISISFIQEPYSLWQACWIQTLAQNFINKDFFFCSLKEFNELNMAPQFQIKSPIVVKMKRIRPFSERIGDLHDRICFEVAENLAVSVLFGTYFIDQYILSIFPVEREVFP